MEYFFTSFCGIFLLCLVSECVCVLAFFFFFVQTQWMAAQQTVMGTENVWPDTATASLDSWVPTVPKVGNISPPIRPQLWFLLCQWKIKVC